MNKQTNKNYNIRLANKKDIPLLVDNFLYAQENKAIFLNTASFWMKKLSKKELVNLIGNWFKNKHNEVFILEDKKKNCFGFLRSVIFTLDPIMKLNKICSLKEFVIVKDKQSSNFVNSLLDFVFKYYKKTTKYFTIHVAPEKKDLIKNYIKYGFNESYLFMGKRKSSSKPEILNNLTIEPANKLDLNKLIELSILFEKEESKIAGKGDFWRSYQKKDLIKKDILNLLKDKNNYYFLAKINNKIVGYLNAIVEETPPTTNVNLVCSLKILFVLPKYRGNGISSKLIGFMENEIKKTNNFVISVSSKNQNAINIYQKKEYLPLYLCLTKKIS